MFPLITYLHADITVSHGTIPHILSASAVCSVKSATNCGVTYLPVLVLGIAGMAWMPVVEGGEVQGCIRCCPAVCASLSPFLCCGHTVPIRLGTRRRF